MNSNQFNRLFTNLKHNLLLIPGWRTTRKIVVIESDDWGSIRMPSLEVFNELKKEGFQPGNDPYLKYDSLASEDDLSALFEVLSSVKDKNGNPAIITANTVVANPDFKKIKESGFQNYYYEPFTETLKRYPQHKNSFSLWQEGIKSRIFKPQFHAREHLNVDQWMMGLKKNDSLLMKAFEYEMISISSIPSKLKFSYMESFDFFSTEEDISKDIIIKEGLDLFEHIFGFRSKSFIASCYIWSNKVERVLKQGGVEYLQGISIRKEPKIIDSKHAYKNRLNYTGKKNNLNQKYLVRNVFFEPSHYPYFDSVNDCMNRINVAFRWNKPAIISSHRLNFIGSIDEKNRTINLKLLKELLNKIVTKWPDVEFLASDELGKLL
jgi:hypothetical protein